MQSPCSLSFLIGNLGLAGSLAPNVGEQTQFSCHYFLNAGIVTPLCPMKSFFIYSASISYSNTD